MIKDVCATCGKKAGILKCQGCNSIFCRDDLNTHRDQLGQQLEEFMDEIDTFQQTSKDVSVNLKSSMINHIDIWEKKSVQKIKEIAEETRQQVEILIVSGDKENTADIREIAEQIHQSRQNDEFDEQDLRNWKERLEELQQIISNPYISIDEQ